MDKQAQIRNELKRMASAFGPDATMLATVKAVNPDGKTCDLVDDDGLEFVEVRLRPVIDGTDGMTLVPKVNTWALAVRIEDGGDWMVLAAGEVTKWRLAIDEAVLEQTEDGLLISNSGDTLKQALTLIVEAVQKIVVIQGTNPDYAKLTTALNKINNLLR